MEKEGYFCCPFYNATICVQHFFAISFRNYMNSCEPLYLSHLIKVSCILYGDQKTSQRNITQNTLLNWYQSLCCEQECDQARKDACAVFHRNSFYLMPFHFDIFWQIIVYMSFVNCKNFPVRVQCIKPYWDEIKTFKHIQNCSFNHEKNWIVFLLLATQKK